MKRRATVICERHGRVLLVAREGGRWAFPGGRQKAGEDLSITAARELEEETRLNAHEVRYLFQFRGLRTTHFVFAARIGEDRIAMPSHEIVRCEWMRLDRLGRVDASLPTKGIAEIMLKHARSSRGLLLAETVDDLAD